MTVTKTPSAAKLSRKELEAVLLFHKTTEAVADALRAHFFEGVTLEAAGVRCGMKKQGFAYHVDKVHAFNKVLHQAIEILKKR